MVKIGAELPKLSQKTGLQFGKGKLKKSITKVNWRSLRVQRIHCVQKKTPLRFLLYLRGKCLYFHKIFRECSIFTHESSYCFQRVLAIAIPSVSVTRVNQLKTVQDKITKSSPSAAWKTL